MALGRPAAGPLPEPFMMAYAWLLPWQTGTTVALRVGFRFNAGTHRAFCGAPVDPRRERQFHRRGAATGLRPQVPSLEFS